MLPPVLVVVSVGLSRMNAGETEDQTVTETMTIPAMTTRSDIVMALVNASKRKRVGTTRRT